jgi:hypothetical protein
MGSSPHFSPPARNRCGSLPESNLAASKALVDRPRIALGSRTAESEQMYPHVSPSSGFFIKEKPPCTLSKWALLFGFRSKKRLIWLGATIGQSPFRETQQ